eukprot:119072-Pelagomonas_calceolata.AAC.2
MAYKVEGAFQHFFVPSYPQMKRRGRAERQASCHSAQTRRHEACQSIEMQRLTLKKCNAGRPGQVLNA